VLADDIPAVAAAHWSGASAAMEHLISLGHRRIAAITGPMGWPASIDRLAAYRAAMAGAQLPLCDELICRSDFQIEGGYQAAKRLLALPEPPTAIFAFNDNMAMGTLTAARELGLTLPRDLSIVGFDDSLMAALATPQLTTVRQPLQEMGRIAASLLCRMLDRQPLEAARIELSTRLIVRGSTAPPHAAS
jgi:LacI family transcriptional regulator